MNVFGIKKSLPLEQNNLGGEIFLHKLALLLSGRKIGMRLKNPLKHFERNHRDKDEPWKTGLLLFSGQKKSHHHFPFFGFSDPAKRKEGIEGSCSE